MTHAADSENEGELSADSKCLAHLPAGFPPVFYRRNTSAAAERRRFSRVSRKLSTVDYNPFPNTDENIFASNTTT
jgi:hypothetical protein